MMKEMELHPTEEDCYGSLEEYFIDCCRYGDKDEVIGCLDDGVDH